MKNFIAAPPSDQLGFLFLGEQPHFSAHQATPLNKTRIYHDKVKVLDMKLKKFHVCRYCDCGNVVGTLALESNG